MKSIKNIVKPDVGISVRGFIYGSVRGFIYDSVWRSVSVNLDLIKNGISEEC